METSEPRVGNRPVVFDYHDYRSYLKDWFAYVSSINSAYSMRSIAKQMGYSHNYFNLLINGELSLNNGAGEKLLPYLKFSKKEAKYFSLLIVMSDSKDQREQDRALQSIKKLKDFKSVNPKEFEVLEYLSAWYYMAIREMAAFSNFRADPKWIQGRLKERIPLGKIRRALDFLVEHEFILFDVKNRAFIPKKPLYCRDGIFRVALRKFHKHMLEQAIYSIDSESRETRQVVAYTLALNSESYKKAQALIDEVKAKLSELEINQSGEAESVYYFNFASFPIARKNEVGMS